MEHFRHNFWLECRLIIQVDDAFIFDEELNLLTIDVRIKVDFIPDE